MASATATPVVNPFARAKAAATAQTQTPTTPVVPAVTSPQPVENPETATEAPGAIDRVIANKAERAAANEAAAVAAEQRLEKQIPRRRTSSTKKMQPLYFDLETVPDESRLHLFDLPPLPEAVAETPVDELPAVAEFLAMPLADACKKIEGILPHSEWLRTVELTEKAAAKPRKGMFDLVEKARGIKDAFEKANADRIKLLSVTPEYCSIAAMGYAVGDGGEVAMVVGQDNGAGGVITEKDILTKFWELAGECSPLICFYGIGFDLPVIFVRSFILDVAPSRKIDLTSWKDDVHDLMLRRWPRGGQMKLKQLARILGIDVPAGDCDGSQVYELMKSGELEKVATYQRSDITVTRSVHRAYRGFWC